MIKEWREQRAKRKKEKMKNKEASAKKAVLDEYFNDLYNSRHQIYKVNFFRGIFFGFGSVLGGTVVIAIVVWALSFFVNIPVIGDTFQKAQDSIQPSPSQQ